MAVQRRDLLQRAHALARDFRADAVAGQDRDVCLHPLLRLFDVRALNIGYSALSAGHPAWPGEASVARSLAALFVGADRLVLLEQVAELVHALHQAEARKRLDGKRHG